MSELENLQTHNLPVVTPETGDVVRVFRGTETAQCLVSDIGGSPILATLDAEDLANADVTDALVLAGVPGKILQVTDLLALSPATVYDGLLGMSPSFLFFEGTDIKVSALNLNGPMYHDSFTGIPIDYDDDTAVSNADTVGKGIVFRSNSANDVFGSIVSSNVVPDNGGFDYQVGDTFETDFGYDLARATAAVDSVDPDTGALLTYHWIANPVTSFKSTGVSVTTLTGIGNSAVIDVTELDYSENATELKFFGGYRTVTP